MKRFHRMIRLLLCTAAVFVCLLVLPAEADAAELGSGDCGDTVTWSVDDSGTLTISGTGETDEFVDRMGSLLLIQEKPWHQWNDQIRTVVIEPGVTSVGAGTITDLKNLTAIHLPDTVTFVGAGNYMHCDSLTRIHITDLSAWAMTSYESSNDNPLSLNDEILLYLNGEPVIDLVIPEGVPYIGQYAFARYQALRSVTICDAVTDIGKGAFTECDNLEVVRLGKGVERIEYYAFGQCKALRQIHFSTGLQEVEEYAFLNCNAIRDIYLEDLAAWVSIPEDKVLSEPIYEAMGSTRNFYLNGQLLTDVVIPEGVTAIRNRAFQGAKDIRSVSLPASLESMGSASFHGCTALEEVYIADMEAYLRSLPEEGGSLMAVSELPKKLYLKGEPVTEAVIPGTVEKVAPRAFFGCVHIQSVRLEEGVREIGGWCFYGCTALKQIHYPATLEQVGQDALRECPAITDVYIEDLASWFDFLEDDAFGNPLMANELEKKLYLKGKPVTDLVIPEGFTKVAPAAFTRCAGLKTITFPAGMTAIGRNAFSYCTGLKKVVIPGTVKSVDEYAFYQCSGITELVLEEGVEELCKQSFTGCSALERVTFPSTLRKVQYAISGPESLTQIYLADIRTWLVYGCADQIMSDMLVERKLYLNGEPLTRVTVPEELESIPDFAFHNCKTLTEVELPKGLKVIGEGAFQGCEGLTRIRLPEGLTTIGKRAFSGVYHLSEVKLPSTLTTLADRAFYCIWDLKAIDIPGSVTEIGRSAFAHCTELASVTLHEGLKTIGSDAFNACPIESIVIPEGVTTIGWGAFTATQKLKWVVLPASLTTIEKLTFQHSDELWHVLYTGTEKQFKAMTVEEGNDYLLSATIHYGAKGDEVTSAAGKLCRLCGTTCDHKWGSGTVTAAPTCTADGERTYTCASCGEKRTETEPKKGHTPGPAATTESAQTCVSCGIVLQEALPKPVTTVPPASAAPTTAAPTTVPPATAAPTTVPAATAAPTTAAPTTVPPATAAPTTAPAETTTEPEATTAAPASTAAPTAAPETTAPETTAPATQAPAKDGGGAWIIAAVIVLAAAAAAVVIRKRYPHLLEKLRRK